MQDFQRNGSLFGYIIMSYDVTVIGLQPINCPTLSANHPWYNQDHCKDFKNQQMIPMTISKKGANFKRHSPCDTMLFAGEADFGMAPSLSPSISLVKEDIFLSIQSFFPLGIGSWKFFIPQSECFKFLSTARNSWVQPAH